MLLYILIITNNIIIMQIYKIIIIYNKINNTKNNKMYIANNIKVIKLILINAEIILQIK